MSVRRPRSFAFRVAAFAVLAVATVAGIWGPAAVAQVVIDTCTPTAAGSSGTAAGSDTQVQFNDGGTFGGDAGFVYIKGTDSFTLVGTGTLGQVIDSGLTASRLVVSDGSKQLASNGAITTNALTKSASSGASLSASTVTDDGTTVTVNTNSTFTTTLGTVPNLLDSGLTASRIVLSDGTKNLVSNGALTTNKLPKAASSGASLADSTVSDDGTTVTVNTNSTFTTTTATLPNTTLSGTHTLIGTLAGVIPETGASDTTTAAQSGELFTNTGNAGNVAITLLNDPTVGVYYSFSVTVDTKQISVAPNTGETLYLAGTSGACSSITSSILGSGLSVVAAKGGSGGIWVASGAGFTCNP